MIFDLFSSTKPAGTPEVQQLQLQLGGKVVNYTLKRSRKSRHVRLSITHEKGLQVSAPLRVAQRQVLNFVEAKKSWIAKTLEYYEQFPKFNAADLLSGNATVKYLGENCEVISTQSSNSRCRVLHAEKTLFLRLPVLTPRNAKTALESWYKREARKIIEQRVAFYAPRFDVNVNGIAIRGQRTRWGSCSSKGNLNFNWKLVMVPLEVIDYLVVHELAHVKELNHSKRFWNLVATHCPNYKLRQDWLKENEPLLNF